ncbi:MAG: amylo-alpha-1,6-glucosidase [Candidatus Zixiibacteriota bacterium]|nr:MAG: amylo-alpha-1,6-glucosidase [candidate division Zixibacteria bacterium]
MEDIIRVKDQYYILATSALADDRTRVLKWGEMFAVFDRYGDIFPVGLGEQGIFFEGTRYLSLYSLNLGPERPLLLSSTVKEDNILLAVDLTNPDVHITDLVAIPRGALHLFRSKFLHEGSCHERLRLANYGQKSIVAPLRFTFEADFADIFEVRGMTREQRGEKLPHEVGDDYLVLGYRGLDGVLRRTRIHFSPPPRAIRGNEAVVEISVPPQGTEEVHLTIHCLAGEPATIPRRTFEAAHLEVLNKRRRTLEATAGIYTSNEQFNHWINRSASDLDMMLTNLPQGPFPYAGVPWFNTAFGRDGIITALECLWINPDVARGVLAYLAETQAQAVIPEQDAEPGKILHETRGGEMAALQEVPFGQYYGSVDSTPLFVVLAGAYYEHTGDRDFIIRLWPHVERALTWMDTYGDKDGDGFVEYDRRTPKGLIQQGWKDSHDSIFHADGELAQAPIALCEVQGYVYAARRAAADLAEALSQPVRASTLRSQARALQENFERAFWQDDMGIYAVALDGDKRPCRVRTSNAGQCLFTGIASPDHARILAPTLMGEEFFSGWGIRTLAAGEARYNPMSYHNGSIWPHDNALIARGLSHYRFRELALKVLAGMFDASLFMDLNRLPELFCGFHRRPGEGPTQYPVACSPQAWAAGAVFMLLQACLGLTIRGTQNQVHFFHPALPEFLQEVSIRNLRVGQGSMDLALRRYSGNVAIQVVRREGDVSLLVVK